MPRGRAPMEKVDTVLETDTLAANIKDLRGQQEEARALRQRIAKEVRNTNRKQSRLRKRARLMTDDDLLQVLMMRKTQREDLDKKAAQAPSSSSNACGR